MQEKTVTIIVILAILIVGAVAIAELQMTGAGVVQARTGCECVIEQYDNYGNPIGIQIQQLKVKSRQMTDDTCNNRCEQMFGKTRRGHKAAWGQLDTRPGLG